MPLQQPDHLDEKHRVNTRLNRTIAPAISIAIVATLDPIRFIAMIGTKSAQKRPCWSPRPRGTPGASHKVDCDAARCAARSRPSALPAPGSPRQSRRRGVPVRTSTRRKLCPSIDKLLGTPTSLAPLEQGSISRSPRRNLRIRCRLRYWLAMAAAERQAWSGGYPTVNC